MLANKNLGADLTILSKNGRVGVVGNRGQVEINPRFNYLFIYFIFYYQTKIIINNNMKQRSYVKRSRSFWDNIISSFKTRF